MDSPLRIVLGIHNFVDFTSIEAVIMHNGILFSKGYNEIIS